MNLLKNFFFKQDLKRRLIIFNTILVILSTGILSLVFLLISNKGIKTSVRNSLEYVSNVKKREVSIYFHNKEADMQILAESLEVKNALSSFQDTYKNTVRRESASFFTTDLQRKYITENPNPTGQKDNLNFSDDGSEYSRIHKKYHPFFRKFIKVKKFYDLFLIDAETGQILYTVFKELDYATNLLSGVYKDTNIADLFKKVKGAGTNVNTFFVDFKNYAPSNGDPASFIGTQIIIDGKLAGVLVLQLPIDEINSTMQSQNSTDDSVSSYIIGNDKLFRTSVGESKEKIVLRKKNEQESISLALDGKLGVLQETNTFGREVYSHYSSINIYNEKFVFITERSVSKSLEELNYIRLRTIIAIAIILVITIGLTYYSSREVSNPIMESVNILSTSTREIASTIQQQESNANTQSASANQTTTTMSQLGSSSKHTSDQAQSVSERASFAQNEANHGLEVIEKLMTSMNSLKDKVSTISEQISQLSEKNNQISNIINLVSDLANQTNMLALNAAVEAARAGEYGRGFSVVAIEIRKLADESKKSAVKIQEIIYEIKRATDTSVMVTEEGTQNVEESYELGQVAVQSFQGINQSISGVFESTEQISLNVQQQSMAINEVLDAMNSLNQSSTETANGIAQTKIGIEQLNRATSNLQELVSGIE
ncbi:MAG: methyl-accepting chemotaxis protein [Spirochaetota bacterium]